MGFMSMCRRSAAVLVGVLLAVLAFQSVATAAPAGKTHSKVEAQDFPPGEFFIRNVESNLVLDVAWGSHDEGAPVVLWHRNGKPHQLWSYDNGFLVSKNSGLVLEVEGMSGGGNIAPGTGLVQSSRRARPDNLNQLWAYNYMYLMPYDPKVVVAAEYDNLQAGAKAVVDRAVDFPNNIRQQWAFETP
jgi:Ricin-type beta-trefoil lectin domain-like